MLTISFQTFALVVSDSISEISPRISDMCFVIRYERFFVCANFWLSCMSVPLFSSSISISYPCYTLLFLNRRWKAHVGRICVQSTILCISEMHLRTRIPLAVSTTNEHSGGSMVKHCRNCSSVIADSFLIWGNNMRVSKVDLNNVQMYRCKAVLRLKISYFVSA